MKQAGADWGLPLPADCGVREPADGGCLHPAALPGHPGEHGAEQPSSLSEDCGGDHSGAAPLPPPSVSVPGLGAPPCPRPSRAEEVDQFSLWLSLQLQPGDPDVRNSVDQRPLPEGSRGQEAGKWPAWQGLGRKPAEAVFAPFSWGVGGAVSGMWAGLGVPACTPSIRVL